MCDCIDTWSTQDDLRRFLHENIKRFNKSDYIEVMIILIDELDLDSTQSDKINRFKGILDNYR